MKILVIEDERKVANFIRQGLSESGHSVEVAVDGESGLKLAREKMFDIIILDWLLPGMPGITVCRKIREFDSQIPILMLTARGTTEDKITGLDSGADDYLTKPFAFEELKARIRALSRRAPFSRKESSILTFRDIWVDLLTRRVFRGEREIFLSNKEYELLVYFLKHQNQVITRKQLAKDVWKIDFETGTNFVEVYITYLRKKLGSSKQKPLILTLRGAGYMIKGDPGEND